MSLHSIYKDYYDAEDSFYKKVYSTHDNSYESELKILSVLKQESDDETNYFITKDIKLAKRLTSIILQPFMYDYEELKCLHAIDKLTLEIFNMNHYKYVLKKPKCLILYFNNCEKHLPEDIKKDFPKITAISHTKKLIIDNKPNNLKSQIIQPIKHKKITRRTTKKKTIIEEDEDDLFVN